MVEPGCRRRKIRALRRSEDQRVAAQRRARRAEKRNPRSDRAAGEKRFGKNSGEKGPQGLRCAVEGRALGLGGRRLHLDQSDRRGRFSTAGSGRLFYGNAVRRQTGRRGRFIDIFNFNRNFTY